MCGPGGIERSGLGYDILSKRNPKLVYCALTGYGLEGPDANAPGFDVASFWSRSGLARLTAPKGSELFPVRTAAGDHTTSIAAVAAINAALIQALKTGKGQLVDVSLLRTGLYTLHTDLAIQLFFGRNASTRPRAEAYNPLTNFFRTKDDAWICIVARAGKSDLPRMARAFDLPGIDTDPRFQDGKVAARQCRRDHRDVRRGVREVHKGGDGGAADGGGDRLGAGADAGRSGGRSAGACGGRHRGHAGQGRRARSSPPAARRASMAWTMARRARGRSWASTRGRC